MSIVDIVRLEINNKCVFDKVKMKRRKVYIAYGCILKAITNKHPDWSPEQARFITRLMLKTQGYKQYSNDWV